MKERGRERAERLKKRRENERERKRGERMKKRERIR